MKKTGIIVCCFILLSNISKAAVIQLNENPGRLHRPRSILSTQEATFLINAADAMMMNIKEGKEARLKGKTVSVRNYGELMVKQNMLLLSRIQKLAQEKRFRLSSSISKQKQEGLKELISKNGEEFDKKFLKMIKTDHKRDIREFKKAVRYNDKQISTFASEQLPMLKSQRDKLRSIKR